MSRYDGKDDFQPPTREKRAIPQTEADTETSESTAVPKTWQPSKKPAKKPKHNGPELSDSDKSLIKDVIDLNKQTPGKKPNK